MKKFDLFKQISSREIDDNHFGCLRSFQCPNCKQEIDISTLMFHDMESCYYCEVTLDFSVEAKD